MERKKRAIAHEYGSREPSFFRAAALRAVVAIVIEMEDGSIPSNTTEAGDARQVVFAGSPVQVGVTAEANPFWGVIFREYIAFCPAVIDCAVGFVEMAKLPGGAACEPTVTVMGEELTALRLLSPKNWTVSWWVPSASATGSVAASSGKPFPNVRY